jgi:hypothetical protein
MAFQSLALGREKSEGCSGGEKIERRVNKKKYRARNRRPHGGAGKQGLTWPSPEPDGPLTDRPTMATLNSPTLARPTSHKHPSLRLHLSLTRSLSPFCEPLHRHHSRPRSSPASLTPFKSCLLVQRRLIGSTVTDVRRTSR